MAPLPIALVAGELAVAVGFGLALNMVKIPVFVKLRIG